MKVPSGLAMTFHGASIEASRRLTEGAFRESLSGGRAGTSTADMMYRLIDARVMNRTAMVYQATRYGAGQHCACPMLVKGKRLWQNKAYLPATDDSDSEDGLEEATHYENLGHVAAHGDGCHIVTVRNRFLHGGITLFEVLITVRHYHAHVNDFHLPWREPDAIAVSGPVDLP
jgi:hypothetical protein